MDPSQLEGAIRSTLRLQEMVYNDMLVPEAARGNDNTLWQTFRGGVAAINHTWAFTDTPKPIELIKHRGAPSGARSAQWLILWTRETGVLSRSLVRPDGDVVPEQAATSQGLIWTDLPFMLQDVQKAWTDAVMSMTDPSHCLNLTAAIARLAAVGLLADAFSGCGFEIMMQTLEVSKTTSHSASTGFADGSEQIDARMTGESVLTLPRLLPLLQCWLHYAGRKLLQLSVAMNPSEGSGWRINSHSAGVLSQDQDIDTAYCSKARFRIWKEELGRLKERDFVDITTKETAKACSRLIDSVWDESFGVRPRKAAD